MIEIAKNIFKFRVNLPNNPLKYTNSFLIRGDRNLLIDNGFNQEECKEDLYKGLDELNIDMSDTDIFLTHMHGDHSGLTSTILKPEAAVYISKDDSEFINPSKADIYWDSIDETFREYGMPQFSDVRSVDYHPGKLYKNGCDVEFTTLSDGDSLTVGDYSFDCIETPGHSPGHMCLYEPNKKFLFSGDHILGDITPNISIEYKFINPLEFYLESLKKVSKLDIERTFPAHRRDIDDVYERIYELQTHHKDRLDEAQYILGNKALNAYEVATQIHWDLRYDSFDDFPVAQKWFALGESAAHLNCLYYRDMINRDYVDGVLCYSNK